MKKVLLVGNHEIVIYNFRKEIIERLLEENYEVYIVLPYGKKVDILIDMGCHFIDLPIDRRGTNPIRDFSLFMNCIKIFKQIKPNVVLTYTIKPNIYGGIACKLLSIPFIANITGLGTSIENSGILHKFSLFLYKIGLYNANCVFFQNKSNLDFFINKKIVKGNMRLVPGSGVNIKEHCYEEYPSESNYIRFIYVGRLMRDKGIVELFNAIPKVIDRYSNVYFDIVGDSEEDFTKQIEVLHSKYNTTYHGRQNNIHDFIKNSHAIILPSYHEGMANVLLEAAACGRPILASKVPGCIETFNEGVSGLGFEPRNDDSLVQTIIEFIKMPYEQKKIMGIAGRQKIEKEFDRQLVVNANMEEIGKII